MTLIQRSPVFLAAAISTLTLISCGYSVYSAVTPETSDQALLEKAVLAMDEKDFGKAKSALSELWTKDKSNKITQLYANSILGYAGFDLYEIILNILKTADSNSLKSANDILGVLGDILTIEASSEQLDDLHLTLEVLSQAENQKSTALEFQKCLTVGIYALPIVNGISDSITEIGNTIDALPAKLNVSSTDNRTCQASTETISSVGDDLSNTILQIGLISSRIADINEVIMNCSTLSDNTPTASVNALTSKVDSIIRQADRGCEVPETGVLGARFLPSCMTRFIEETASEAIAGDGLVNGCEVFINCSRSSCISQ